MNNLIKEFYSQIIFENEYPCLESNKRGKELVRNFIKHTITLFKTH